MPYGEGRARIILTQLEPHTRDTLFEILEYCLELQLVLEWC